MEIRIRFQGAEGKNIVQCNIELRRGIGLNISTRRMVKSEIVGQWIRCMELRIRQHHQKVRSGKVFFTDTETFKAEQFDVVEKL